MPAENRNATPWRTRILFAVCMLLPNPIGLVAFSEPALNILYGSTAIVAPFAVILLPGWRDYVGVYGPICISLVAALNVYNYRPQPRPRQEITRVALDGYQVIVLRECKERNNCRLVVEQRTTPLPGLERVRWLSSARDERSASLVITGPRSVRLEPTHEDLSLKPFWQL